MPEIAEVETVRRVLKKKLIGRRIIDVNVLYEKMIESDILQFKKSLVGLEFKDILRKGKWLIFDLEPYYLCSHLRMEGKYFIKKHDEEIVKHEHIIFSLDSGYDLRYHDTRKFGRMNLVLKENLNSVEGVRKQGIEPIDSKLNALYLYDNFKRSKLPIKTLLLDQTIISGLGNIYADEVLFDSKILPTKKGIDISLSECENIVKSAKIIIEKAICNGGTTIKSYTSSLGVIGNYQKYLCVHKNENKPCLNCNTIVKRIKVGGRSTYYCPNCQK